MASPLQQQRTPFPSRTGRGVRVAVVDSGVNRGHSHIVSLEGGVSVRPSGQIEEGDYVDVLGHGTAVMAAIQEKAPDAKYFALKVFHSALRTSAGALLSAIEWAIEQRMDIVNLSLGTRNRSELARFETLVSKAAKNGVLLVAARDADGQPCLPGSLAGVFGVRLDWEMPRDLYRCEQTSTGKLYFASGYPRSLPGVAQERNLHGISFAVANMTGFIARACEEIQAAGAVHSFDAVSMALHAEVSIY